MILVKAKIVPYSSNGIIQGTLQLTLLGRKFAPLAAAPVPFTGLVAAAQ